MSEYDEPVKSTSYNQKELNHFKNRLKKEQQQTKETLDELKKSRDRLTDNQGEAYSGVNHHIGDMGSKEEEKETDYQLIGRNEDKLNEIKGALDRIEQGTYGICEDTGKKIKKGRLEAKPWARYSVAASKDEESPQ